MAVAEADMSMNPEEEYAKQMQNNVSLWGDWCMWCKKDWAWETGCPECEHTYDKLKAQDRLPRRREAIMATKLALGDVPKVD